jgi:hypothetical protein
MDKIGRDNFTPEQLVNILSNWPSNNEHSIYNVLMINSLDVFDGKLIANDQPAPI